MKIFAVTAGSHDTEYLAYFTKESLAIKFKKECENAPTRNEWEATKEVIDAQKEWEDLRNEINTKFPDTNLFNLSFEIKDKWFSLINAWKYNHNWGYSNYDIEEIDVVEN